MSILDLLSGDPQQVARNLANQYFPNDPNIQNLIQMGQNGNVQELTSYAQQFFGQKGMDFNAEMNKLMSLIGHK